MNLTSLLVHSEAQWVDVATLILRLFIGICFVVHGLGKLGLVGPGSLQGFEDWLKSLGVPVPALQARAAMLCELLGGTMIAGGFLMRAGCLLCLFTMVVAATIGHRGGGYLITNNPPGNEYTINLAAICSALFIIGPGRYSIDALLFS